MGKMEKMENKKRRVERRSKLEEVNTKKMKKYIILHI